MSEKAVRTGSRNRTKNTTVPVVQMFTLTPEHFVTREHSSKTVLSLDESVMVPVSRVSATLFYRTRKCEHSAGFVEAFKQAARLLTQASIQSSPPLPLPQFLLCTLNGPNRRIVRMARKTETPIEYTPQLVLFVNNLPFKSFEWPEDSPTRPDADAIYNFIARSLNEVHQTTAASMSVPTPPPSQANTTGEASAVANTGPKPIIGRDLRIYTKLGVTPS